MDQFARIFFDVQAGDANALGAAVAELDLDPAVGSKG
jgi:hypothetical protein